MPTTPLRILVTNDDDVVPLAADATDAFKPQDCESELDNPQDEAEAFTNGFNSLSQVPVN